MKNKLLNHFASYIVISNLDGRHDIVSLKVTTSSIKYNFHKNSKEKTPDGEKLHIVSTAATLIKMIFSLLKCQKCFTPPLKQLVY